MSLDLLRVIARFDLGGSQRMSRSYLAPLFATLVFIGPGCTKQADCKGAAQVCGGSCVELKSDDLNCGACGTACDAGQVCSAGSCQLSCQVGLLDCGGKCVDPATDRSFCGAGPSCAGSEAGAVCGAGSYCEAGRCQSAPAIRTIQASLRTDHWLDDGLIYPESSPDPWWCVGALVPDPVAGGYREIPGFLGLDGTVTIPDVPVGQYLLHLVATTWVETPGDCSPDCVWIQERLSHLYVQFDASAPPLTRLVATRPALAHTTSITPVTFSISNLDVGPDPRSAPRSMLFVGSSQLGLDGFVFPGPARGATTFDATMDWSDGGLGFGVLPDALHGDRLLLQQRMRILIASGGVTGELRLTTRAAAVPGVTVVDGVGGTVAATLAEAPLSETLEANYATTAFAAAAMEGVPSAATVDPLVTSAFAGVYAAPHAVKYPAPSPSGPGLPTGPGSWTRLVYLDFVGAETEDVNLGGIAYGGFLPGLWKEFELAGYSAGLEFLDPLGQLQATGATSVLSEYPIGERPAGIFRPRLSPPRSLAIGGQLAGTALTGVGTTPTISWDPPTIGVPTCYEVSIVSVDGSAPGVAARLYGVLSFQVPPDLLVPGRTYLAYVTALEGPGYEENLDPFIASYPRHQADAITAPFTP